MSNECREFGCFSERETMRDWLDRHCRTKIEWDFWYEFYDDLDDCFDDLEPWRLAKRDDWVDWHEWDRKFTGRRIRPDKETRRS